MRPPRPFTAAATGTVAAMAAAGAAGALATTVPPGTHGSIAATALSAIHAAQVTRSPHAVLVGAWSEVASVLVTNLPPLLGLVLAARARWSRFGFWCLPGDLVVIAVGLGTAFRVGAALAAHGASLLPFLPHLPFELAAVALACSTWRVARRRRVRIGPALAGVLLLAIVAAAVEVYATPHSPRPVPGVNRARVCPGELSGRVDLPRPASLSRGPIGAPRAVDFRTPSRGCRRPL